MAQREVDIKNAEAAGRIQFAINLLNTRLNYFIQVLKISSRDVQVLYFMFYKISKSLHNGTF
jgi:hypothetical protein